MRSIFAIIGRSVAQYVTQRPAAGVSLTFINPASPLVFGYGIQAANPVKLDFLPILFQS
jgi:hypothetical protein